LLDVDVDEQAVAARPRPIMTDMILAIRQDFTVLPSWKGQCLPSQLENPDSCYPVRAGVGRPAVPT
jgi:hypothetical protein